MAPKKRSKKQEETPDSTPVYLTGSLSKLVSYFNSFLFEK